MQTFKVLLKIALILFLFIGCSAKSELIEDTATGMNGSFEVFSSGLPVNWMVYSPNTVPDSDFEIHENRNSFKHGNQSIQFDINKCSDVGGNKSPGLAKEFEGKQRTSYHLSIWVKNEGCNFVIKLGGVNISEGNMETVADQSTVGSDWQLIEHDYYLTDDFSRIRLEINITSPGKINFDGVSIVGN